MKCIVISFKKEDRRTTIQAGDTKIYGYASRPKKGFVLIWPDHASRWHEPPFRLKLNGDGGDLKLATIYEHVPELRAR